MFFPAVLSFLAVPRALVGLAVVLGSVEGFHLEAPASQGRGERACPTLQEAQQAHWGSAGQATRAWDWNVLSKGFAVWGLIVQSSSGHSESSWQPGRQRSREMELTLART